MTPADRFPGPEFGIVMEASPGYTARLAKQIEDLGFDMLLCPDTQNLSPDPFSQLALAAQTTTRLRLGTGVTNPVTRDAAVTACTLATLQAESNGRVICGIGRGDSAVRVTNGKPVSVAELREAVVQLKDLTNGRSIDYKGSTIRLPWASDSRTGVFVAAYGPKVLALTGEVGDGFILQLADPQIAAWTIEAVRNAAEAAGRNPDDVYICVAAPAYVTDDVDHARDQLRWFGGMVGNHVADIVERYGEGGGVPKALTDYIKGRQGYDYNQHGQAGNTHADFVPDEIVDRFCIIGPVEEHVRRLEELKALGVDQFALYLQHDDKDHTLLEYGERIIPAIQDTVLAKS
jgi:probable F420-dependent oxidoreductase